MSSLSSLFLYRFLDDVWDLLPTEDRDLFEAYWRGKLRIAGDLEQKTLEASQSTEVAEVPVFLTERWNRFVMDEDTTDQGALRRHRGEAGRTRVTRWHRRA